MHVCAGTIICLDDNYVLEICMHMWVCLPLHVFVGGQGLMLGVLF